MIKNLTESDDEQVCKRAQYVLTAIEGGDKDIVKLRLQKAMDAQTDATKKARLQLAIKRLSEPFLMDF